MNRKWRVAIAIPAALLGFLYGFMRWESPISWWWNMPRSAATALDGAEDYEILSLHPMLSDGEFHFHQVLGRVKIADGSVRGELNDALKRAARESRGRTRANEKPRLGIRVRIKDQTVDFRIDFESGMVRVYRNGEVGETFAVSASARPKFDEILQKAGIAVVGHFDQEEAEYQRFKGQILR